MFRESATMAGTKPFRGGDGVAHHADQRRGPMISSDVIQASFGHQSRPLEVGPAYVDRWGRQAKTGSWVVQLAKGSHSDSIGPGLKPPRRVNRCPSICARNSAPESLDRWRNSYA